MHQKTTITISLMFILLAIVVPGGAAEENSPAPVLQAGIQTPSGIAVDAAGNVYVTNSYANSMGKFSPDGRLLATWGSKGSGDGQFDGLANIAIDTENIVYVTDTFNNRVQKFSSDGRYQGQWAFLKNADTGPIWTDPCYPACQWETHSLGGITTGDDGTLYLVDRSNNSIRMTTRDGAFLGGWGRLGNEDGQFDNPSDIARDPDGNLFVADFANSRVQKFSSDGMFLLSFGARGDGDGQFITPGGIATDQNGFVYVTDTGLHRVQKFTGAGTFVTRWGTEGTADGQFSYPHDVTVDRNGNVYVTDFSNNRIQKFTTNGSYLGKWVGTPPPSPQLPKRTIVTVSPAPSVTERDDNIGVNLTDYLRVLNQELYWGYSHERLDQYSRQLRENLGPEYGVTGSAIHIRNFTRFSEELRDSSLLTEEQRLALLYFHKKELEYRIAYYEIPGFTSPGTPHHAIEGRVTDDEGRPVPGAAVRFVSDLPVENTSLSSTTRSDSSGTYNLEVVWGNRQDVSVTKEGYVPYRKTGITITNESTTLDFTLTRESSPSPGLPVPAAIAAVLIGGAFIIYRLRKYR